MKLAPPDDLFRPLSAIAVVGLLLTLSVWILKPFLPALVWATMVAVATWPMMLAVQRRAGGRRWVAVTAMTLAMLLVFVVPLSLAIVTLVVHTEDITGWVKSFDVKSLETLPRWIAELPVVGAQLDAAWRDLASTADLSGRLAPYAGEVASWLLGELGGVGAILVQFLMTLVIAALLYSKGEIAGQGVLRAAHRLGGARAGGAVLLAARAIRGVALGVVVTALAQSVLGGIGLAIAGVPYAALLTAAMFMLAVAQIGAGPVLLCATLWVFWKGDTGWGVALAVWTLLVSALDNVLRPYLIRKGADLPLLLIFVGVIGGLMAFGLVGIFVGPIVLAVSYTLLSSWIDEGQEREPKAPADSPESA